MNTNINTYLNNSNNSSGYIQQLIDEKILDNDASPSTTLSIPHHQITPSQEFIDFLTKPHPVYTRNKEPVGNLEISLNGWLIENFYCTRYRKKDLSWSLHGFYYGKSKRSVEWMQVARPLDRSFIFKESAIKRFQRGAGAF